MQPLVTVLTPTYNCRKYLKQTIDSVVNQQYCNLQYLVLDDGSQDGSPACVGRDLLSRCQVMWYEHEGEQRTVNKGLMNVKGKYFMIVNADDPLKPGCIEILVNFMEEHNDALCVYPDWECINEDGQALWTFTTHPYDFLFMVRRHTCLPSVGTMFRSSIIKTVGFRDTSFHWLGDFDYWLRIGRAGRMARYPQVLACWRKRSGQESEKRSDGRAEEHVRVIQKLYSTVEEGDLLLEVQCEALCWANLVASGVCKSKAQMVKYATMAFLEWPMALTDIEFWDAARHRVARLFKRTM